MINLVKAVKFELNDAFDFMADAAKVKNPKSATDVFLAAAEGIRLNPTDGIGPKDSLSKADILLGSTAMLTLKSIMI